MNIPTRWVILANAVLQADDGSTDQVGAAQTLARQILEESEKPRTPAEQLRARLA